MHAHTQPSREEHAHTQPSREVHAHTNSLMGKSMLTHAVYRRVHAHTQLSGEEYKHFVGVEYKPGRPNVE